jgi:hypothetical protein
LEAQGFFDAQGFFEAQGFLEAQGFAWAIAEPGTAEVCTDVAATRDTAKTKLLRHRLSHIIDCFGIGNLLSFTTLELENSATLNALLVIN